MVTDRFGSSLFHRVVSARFFSIGYQIKAFYSMIIFVGAVKITDCEDQSWKTRIIHSKMFSLCFFTSDLLHGGNCNKEHSNIVDHNCLCVEDQKTTTMKI